MNISNEEEFHQEIPIPLVFYIRVSFQTFLACTFCQSLGHQIDNYRYWSSQILPAQIIPIDYRPYLMSTPIQSFVSNVHNLVYLLALPSVFHKNIVIPHVFISLTKMSLNKIQ
jgi:hypothetical protein